MKTFGKIIGFVAGLTLLLVLAVLAYFFLFTHSSAVNFQEYQPTQMPGGATIKNKTIEVWSSKTNPFVYSKQLSLGLSAGNSYISETNAKSAPALRCGLNAVNDKCTTQFSPKHQSYTLISSFDSDSGKPFDQTLRLVKNKTYIWINWESNGTLLAQSDWGTVVDSLQPVHYTNVEIKHFSPGP